jgi:hypothetical protein
MAVLMKIESPQTIGVDVPRPGSLTFQRTLRSSPHVVGGSADGAAPLASGPRHCGQFDSLGVVVSAAAAAVAAAPMAGGLIMMMTDATNRTPHERFR